HDPGAFLNGTGLQTGDFGIAAPRLALFEPAATAAGERDEDDGADEIQGHSARHGPKMRTILLRIHQRSRIASPRTCAAKKKAARRPTRGFHSDVGMRPPHPKSGARAG